MQQKLVPPILKVNTSHINFSFMGPELAEGTLPAVFYFALSAEASLAFDPFNQFVLALPRHAVRIFSCNLPCHEPEDNFHQAIGRWAKSYEQGEKILETFVQNVHLSVQELIAKGIIQSDKIATAGLSRGGFIASLVAALNKQISVILGFAPITELSYTREFRESSCREHITALNLENHVENLAGKQLRFYIGNRDTRVSTDCCFHFIRKLTEANFQQRIRSLPAEMVISPSVGHQGHGTLPYIFQGGAHWLTQQLGLL